MNRLQLSLFEIWSDRLSKPHQQKHIMHEYMIRTERQRHTFHDFLETVELTHQEVVAPGLGYFSR